METIPHRELRNNSSSVLARVAAGESIAVTNHGTVVAVLVPPSMPELERLRKAGAVRLPPSQRPEFSGIPRATGLDSADVLADLRGDRGER